MAYDYPLLLDVSDRQIVIIGGGEVAVRKAEGLLAAGATRVRVVAPKFHSSMPPGVARVAETYCAKHLDGAHLVFATTDNPAVNDQIVQDARARNLLVCRADADDDNAGDFATPALLRTGPALVTVSSGGSPALAAKMRDAIEDAIDPRWIKMAEAMLTLRPQIRAAVSLAPSRRREVFRDLATDAAMDVLMRSQFNGLCDWLKQKYPELKELSIS